LYRYFVGQSSEFCRHNTLCFFSTSVHCCCCCCLFRYRLSPETFWYIFVRELYEWKSVCDSWSGTPNYEAQPSLELCFDTPKFKGCNMQRYYEINDEDKW